MLQSLRGFLCARHAHFLQDENPGPCIRLKSWRNLNREIDIEPCGIRLCSLCMVIRISCTLCFLSDIDTGSTQFPCFEPHIRRCGINVVKLSLSDSCAVCDQKQKCLQFPLKKKHCRRKKLNNNVIQQSMPQNYR